MLQLRWLLGPLWLLLLLYTYLSACLSACRAARVIWIYPVEPFPHIPTWLRTHHPRAPRAPACLPARRPATATSNVKRRRSGGLRSMHARFNELFAATHTIKQVEL